MKTETVHLRFGSGNKTHRQEHRLFERIALTHDQINKFGLQDLKNPDPEVLRKLEKDPNSQAFINENGSLFHLRYDKL